MTRDPRIDPKRDDNFALSEHVSLTVLHVPSGGDVVFALRIKSVKGGGLVCTQLFFTMKRFRRLVKNAEVLHAAT